MRWNWQQEDWPEFTFRAKELEKSEAVFLHESGLLRGGYRHIREDDRDVLIVDLISNEALMTSRIEGEYLNRDSLQSSIRRNFGLQADRRRVPPAEAGIAEMMVNLYQTFNEPLSAHMLFAWHEMLMQGRRDVLAGAYRVDEDPMQVVSGAIHNPRVHFEAPPATAVNAEMQRFVRWFNDTGPEAKNPLPALTRAGIAHLYFECIHPFDDGNGRIGRAIAEKALSQSLGYPTLIALSFTIEKHKKAYYDALELNNKTLEITEWLTYFAGTVLEAQDHSLAMVNFLIEKTKLYDRLRGHLNLRQEKALTRMFREGPDGFKGGLSAENYISITGASRSTATRDLQGLVELGALTQTGRLKGMRYRLNLAEAAF